MYNQTAVFKGGYAHAADDNHPIIDTSHFLTTAKGNHLYVNEVGDDSKNGKLDMKGHKIVNLGNPDRNNDASNKFYVDDSIVKATKNYGVLVKELEILNKDLIALKKSHANDIVTITNSLVKTMTDLGDVNERIITNRTDIEKTRTETTKSHTELKSLIAREQLKIDNLRSLHDTSIRGLEADIVKLTQSLATNMTGVDRLLKLRPKQYGFLLDIGTHLSVVNSDKRESVGKVTSHEMTFPFRVLETHLNLQHSLIAETVSWKDDISSHIRNFKVDTTYLNAGSALETATSKLTVELYTFRSNGTHHWGLHLHAYLLVTIFGDNIPVIKNSSP